MNLHNDLSPENALASEASARTIAPLVTPTPQDHEITPRDRRFGRNAAQRWWFAGDPVATAWHNALSLVFPRGEAFFIDAVRAFRDQTPPKLQREIRAFIQQEVMHSREHLALNRRVTDAGYDISRIEARLTAVLALADGRPTIARLAVTMALEHFTAIMAKEFIVNRAAWDGVDAQDANLWRWHAMEEIEHKGVAYDTWLYATRDWSRWRRWQVKALTMTIITQRFWTNRWKDALDLLAQDGMTGWRTQLRLARFLLVSPGIARKTFIPWVKYFLPGFHPWNEDDRHLIALAESDYDAALADHLRMQPAE